MPYLSVPGRSTFEAVIKGSRFLVISDRVEGQQEAAALRTQARQRHPDASHHCLAWRVEPAMGADDDGEPGGTAGRPMLEVLLKRDLDRVAVVCVRWFGGTKLGAGGLARAYGGTAAKALDACGTVTVHERISGTVHVPFARVDAVHRLLNGWADLRKGEPAYDVEGARLPVRLRADAAEALADAVRQATAGEARFVKDR